MFFKDLPGDVKAIVGIAKTNLESDGELVPVVFLGCRGSVKIVPLDMFNDETKSLMVRTVSMLYKESKPEWALHISECWMKKFEKDEAVPENGRVRDVPGRIEAVLFHLKVKDKCYLATAPIIENAGEKTFTIDDIEFIDADGMGGNFADMFKE
jgi:hypothetical protein